MTRRIIPNEILLEQAASFIKQGKSVTIPTKGRSMLPFIIGERDCLVVSPVKDLEVGDIVMARLNSSSNFVVHRIVELRKESVILMGDGNIAARERVKREDVVGQITEIIHNNKHIDCNSKRERRRAKLWYRLLPIRRYLLFVFRHWAGIK